MEGPVLIRSLRGDDAAAIAAFFTVTHDTDPQVRPVTEERWRAFVEYAGNAGGRDFAVAEEQGRVVGVLTSVVLPGESHGRVRRHLRIVVLPSCRRRGIGSALLRLAASQPLEGARTTLQAYLPASWSSALAFFRQSGFETVHTDLEMERDGPPPAAHVVDGYTLRPFQSSPDDAGRGYAEAWARLHNEAFAEDLAFERFDAGRVRAEMRLDGAAASMAVSRGTVVGFCFTHAADPSRGCLQSLVVDERHRRRGVGRALVVAGLRTLAEQGRALVELGVDGKNAAAQALYCSMGFRPRGSSFTLWRDR